MAWKVKQQSTQNTKKWVVKQSTQNQPAKKWVVKGANSKKAPKKQPKGTVWNRTLNQLIKPVASASNAFEDTGKLIAGLGVSAFKGGGLKQNLRKVGFDPLQHQKDVFSGKNQRTYSNIAGDIAKGQDNKLLRGMIKTTGYGGDILLDPLNKVKLLSLTAKGRKAAKTGQVALSAAEKAKKGQSALLQYGNKSLLPKAVDRAAGKGFTKLNDAIRGTKGINQIVNLGSKVSSKVRPLGVGREEFKVLGDAKTTARNLQGYATDKSIDFARNLSKQIGKASPKNKSLLLEAVELGDKSLAPKGMGKVFDEALSFSKNNSDEWKRLGGSILEGHGLSHVATKEVAEQARSKALSGQGIKLISTKTPQDAHRQYAKVNGKVVNLEEQGIKWLDDIYEKGKGGFANRAGDIVDVQQSTAPAINRELLEQGGKAIFQEDLPLAVAKMGISTGKKKAGVEFLGATKGLKGEEAKKLANETYEKITNIESVNKALKGFDAIQNIWKAQALLGPSYHVRNVAGNLWNNNLAGVNVASYGQAGKLQTAMKFGKATTKQKKLYDEMAQNGVIGTGQFTKDIAQEIESKIGKASINPFSQKFGGYRLNRWLGGGIEDNAKIAHYMSKRADGFGAKEAAESVKKYLFDYGDLTFTEQNLLKRVMPFYTWTSKNLPLQVQNFIQKPGKYAKIATAKKNIEQNVEQPNERYMSDYIASNGPIRYKTDEKGNTKYFLIGQWLPAAAAWQVLSRPDEAVIGQTTPLLKLPYETLANQGTFFKNTVGQYDKLTKYPGEKRSYLGLDLDPRTVNALRSIRPLNEINKLNPGEVFGAKNKPSLLMDLGIDNASNQRGGRYTPESTQLDRIGESFIGKSQNYQEQQAKYFYDRDTKSMLNEFNTSISKATSNKQFDLAEKLIEKRNAFNRERNGQTELDEAVEKTNPFYTR